MPDCLEILKLAKSDFIVVFYDPLPHSAIGLATQYSVLTSVYSVLSSLLYNDHVYLGALAH